MMDRMMVGRTGRFTSSARNDSKNSGAEAAHFAGLPESVLSSGPVRRGDYDARRLRSQREVIRDVMLSAAACDTWLTLSELRALTRYGEASISAQLRHLRKFENGGYEVSKQHRDSSMLARMATEGRGECVWEYRIEVSVGRGAVGSAAGEAAPPAVAS